MARLSNTVRSLLTSSLGLPGMQELLALEAPEEQVDYRFTRYDEEPVPAHRLAFGDPRRYEIDAHQFRIVKNLGEDYTLELNYQYETMSGSSPIYALPGPDGPLQVMSGATIREQRDQFDIAASWRGRETGHRGAVGYSTENDYKAIYLSYSGQKESSDALRTWSWGVSYSDDEIEPTDAVLFGRVPYAERDSLSGSLGLTQVLNRNTVLQTGLSVVRQSGFLSDPYKQVWVAREVLYDRRPDERLTFAWTTRSRHYLEATGGALHLDARLYRDDWYISSLTLETAWRQPLGTGWEIAPSLRYYSQEAPRFYAPFYFELPADGLWSSDYRLATYGAISYRLFANYGSERWKLVLGAEYYDSDDSLALFGTPQDTPGLVDFWRFTAGLTIRL